MSTVDLRRRPASETVEANQMIAQLALRAEAVLGYSWLRKKLQIGQGVLAHILEELEIQPFRSDDVKNYKKERACAAEREVAADFLSRSPDVGFLGFPPGTYIKAKWQSKPLREYDGDVPAFALSHAVEIKERMPSVEFEVEELRIEKRYDPFLVVRCGREKFYIDVWNECDFEKQNCY